MAGNMNWCLMKGGCELEAESAVAGIVHAVAWMGFRRSYDSTTRPLFERNAKRLTPDFSDNNNPRIKFGGSRDGQEEC